MKALVKNGFARLGLDVRYARERLRLTSTGGETIPLELVRNALSFFRRVPYFYEASVRPELAIGGAWRTSLMETRKTQIRLIEDEIGYQAFSTHMFFNELISGLWNLSYTSTGLANEAIGPIIDRYTNLTGLKVSTLHASARLPVWGVEVDGGIVTYVSPSHAMQAWLVNNLLGKEAVVCDLGSGFGGMAEKLAHLHQGPIDVWLIDIPANLTTAYLYLAHQFRNVTLFSDAASIAGLGENTGECRFLLVPTILCEAVMDRVRRFDVLSNSGSFSEMDLPTIAYYLNTIKSRYLIETNSNAPAMNSGHREIASLDFPIPSDYRLLTRFIPFDREVSGHRYVTSIYAH